MNNKAWQPRQKGSSKEDWDPEEFAVLAAQLKTHFSFVGCMFVFPALGGEISCIEAYAAKQGFKRKKPKKNRGVKRPPGREGGREGGRGEWEREKEKEREREREIEKES